MRLVTEISIVKTVFPESEQADLSQHLERLKRISAENTGVNMGKNNDYSQGYNIGAWLAASGEDLDFKDLDQIGNELLDENEWGELPVDNTGFFKDGLSNGYTLYSHFQEQ